MEPRQALDLFLNEWDNPATDFVEAHTSGSTGVPKRVRLPKSDMRASALATCRFFGIDRASTLFLPLSLEYIAGKMMAVRARVSGANLIVEHPSNSPLPTDPGCDIHLAAIVPSQIEGLLASPWLHRIKTVIVGGAPLSTAQEQALRNAPLRAFATYGMTETCSHVALRCISEAKTFFKALPGIWFATDTRGCLVIEAPDFSFKRLVTNDVVQLIDSGRFVWLGRADAAFISGAVKVHPEAVEARLAQLMPPECDFRITSRPSERWGRETVLEVSGGDIDAGALLDKIRSAGVLNAAEMPKAVARVDTVPRTSTGKIRRDI